MERREFVTSLLAGTAAVAAAPPARAADAANTARPARAHIVVQDGVPQARELAGILARELVDVGVPHTLTRVRALLDPAQVVALLASERGTVLIGVTDDAAAVVVQAVAASRGQACVRHQHHCIESARLASFVIRL